MDLTPQRLDALVGTLRGAGCVFAEDEAALLQARATDDAELDRLVARRVAGEPVEHVVGWAELCGVRVAVGPGVFVPRARTALLVREAAALLSHGDLVVDLCCGSGAVGMALAAAVGGLVLHAADVDPGAVRYARANLERSGAQVHEGDLDAPLPPAIRGRVDVLVANVPYVPTAAIATMPAEARLHEPRVALDGGADGLDLHRRVAAAAPGWLRPGGHLLVETSQAQAQAVVGVFRAAGLVPRVAWDAELDATVVVGRAPGGEQERRSGPAAGGPAAAPVR